MEPAEDIPLILAPTIFEYNVVRAALAPELATRQLRLAVCGVGEKQARRFCETIGSDLPTCLALIGWGGGLVPDLPAGAFLLADAALYAGLPPLVCETPSIPGLRTGPILTSLSPLLTPAQKQSAMATRALVVEMEAYPLAAWAAQRHIPFVHARVVLDAWDEALPDLGKGLSDSGQLRPGKFLWQIARQPALLRDLWWLSQRTRRLNGRLGQLAQALAQALL